MRKLSHYDVEELTSRVINTTLLPIVGMMYSYHALKYKLTYDQKSYAHCLRAKSWLHKNFSKKLWRL